MKVNSMTDFDKLIKEKTEQNKYNFKNAYWKKFAKTAGIKTGGTISVVIIAAITAVGVFSTVHFSKKGKTSDLQSQPQITISVDDSTQSFNEENTQTITTGIQTQSSTTNNSKRNTTTTISEQSHSTPDSGTQAAKIILKKEEPKKHSTILLRPQIILVDTIKEDVPSDEELRKANSRIIQ